MLVGIVPVGIAPVGIGTCTLGPGPVTDRTVQVLCSGLKLASRQFFGAH